MAGDIINRGKIIIDLVAGKVEIPTPKFDEAIPKQQEMTRAVSAQDKATRALEKATRDQEREREKAAREALRQHRETEESLERLSQGFMKVSRAAVLLGFAQDESLQDLLKNLALVQAGFDMFDGSRKIIRGLGDVMGQAASTGKSLVSVIGAGNIALAGFGAMAVVVASSMGRMRQEYDKLAESARRLKEFRQDLQDRRSSLLSPEQRLAQAEQARSQLPDISNPFAVPLSGLRDAAEKRLKIEEEILSAKRDQLKADADQRRAQADVVRHLQEQYNLAKQRVDLEKGARRSVAASFAQLNTWEQRQASQAVDDARAGKQLSEMQRGLLERLGQSGIVERDREREGMAEGAGSIIERLGELNGASVTTTKGFEDLKKEAAAVAELFAQITQGRSGDTVANELEQQAREIERAAAGLGKAFLKAIKDLESQIDTNRRKAKNFEDAMNRQDGGFTPTW